MGEVWLSCCLIWFLVFLVYGCCDRFVVHRFGWMFVGFKNCSIWSVGFWCVAIEFEVVLFLFCFFFVNLVFVSCSCY